MQIEAGINIKNDNLLKEKSEICIDEKQLYDQTFNDK